MKKGIITTLICLLLMVSGYFLGTYLMNTIDNTKNKQVDKQEDNKQENKPTDKVEDPSLVLTKLIGEWGNCRESGCYGVIVNKNEQNEYTYLPYVMWSEFGGSGIIQNVNKVKDDKYKFTIYFPAYDGMESSSPERTEEFTMDFKDIESRTIYINENKYELVVGDREEFYKSRVYQD